MGIVYRRAPAPAMHWRRIWRRRGCAGVIATGAADDDQTRPRARKADAGGVTASVDRSEERMRITGTISRGAASGI